MKVLKTKTSVSDIMTRQEVGEFYGVRQMQDGVNFCASFPSARIVQVAGEFNNWQPERTPMKRTTPGGSWKTKMLLPAGTYHYRLVVDGQWQQDPRNNATEPNPYGEFNSVLTVR